MGLRISIGIFAYNEEASIGRMIASLRSQNLLNCTHKDVESVSIYCIANGCTDRTAEVSRLSLESLIAILRNPKVQYEVVELPLASKSNSWNEFVHRVSDQTSDYLIMLDADIVLGAPNTLLSLVESLESSRVSSLSVPRVVRNIDLKPRRTIIEALISAIGSLKRFRGFGLAGCAYCARAQVIRQVWLPAGMVGEDAFLNGMVVTDNCLTRTPQPRVVYAPGAFVVFEAYTSLSKLFRVLRRQAVTRAVNAVLWSYLWRRCLPGRAGQLIACNNSSSPLWLSELVRWHVSRAGWWVLPRGVLTRRVEYALRAPHHDRPLAVLLAFVGSCFDLPVNIAANRILRTGKFLDLWESKRPLTSVHEVAS